MTFPRFDTSTGKGLKWLSYFIIPLAGVTLGLYLNSILSKKGIPGSSLLPVVILTLVATGLLFLLLMILSRGTQLICGADYRKIRSYHSLTFLPILLLWSYIATQKAVEESIIDLGSVKIPTEVIFQLLVLAMMVILALFITYMLRQRDGTAANPPLGKIAGRLAIDVLLALVVLSFGFGIYDHFLLSDVQKGLVRYSIAGKTRNVRACPLPSETVVRLDAPRDSVLHSGFGVSHEMFQSNAGPVTYAISVSAPSRASKEWIHKQVGAASAEGWTEDSLDIASDAAGPVELRMKVSRDKASFVSEAFNVCNYYLRLICLPDSRFDIRHRMAFWIAPSVTAKRKSEEKSVILIGIDTLRADHVSFYGYSRKTTPHIDSLARTGVVFENCLSVAPWTLPSFFSIVTSTYPSVHLYGTNVRGVGTSLFKIANFWSVGTISPDYRIKTLAEILRGQGYYTAAFVNNPFLSTEFEFDRGFDEFNQYGPTAKEGIEQILPWLEKHREEKFFLFFHIMDPHDRADASSLRQTASYFGDAGGSHDTVFRYDSAIRFCDEQIGRLMGKLEETDLDQKTLLVVTADHGEEFSEHGETGHGHSLYDEVLLVPLIFHLPGLAGEGTVSKERSSTLDIAPTILQILGLPAPSYYQGNGLISSDDGSAAPAQPLFAEGITFGHEKKAVFSEHYKLIYTTTLDKFELYDLRADPRERRNMIGKLPEVEHRLRQILESFLHDANRGIRVTLKPRAELWAYEGRLTTTGVFINVTSLFPTKSQVFHAGQDSKSIEFRLEGADGVNAFAFDVDPAEAPIRVELTQGNDQPGGSAYLGRSSAHPLRPPVEFDRKMLETLSASAEPDMNKEGIYFWVKKDSRESRSVQIDGETKKELESLGYLN